MAKYDSTLTPSSAVHWRVGDATLTSLSDGYAEMPLAQFVTNVPMEEVAAVQQRALRSATHFRLDINAYLVRSPKHGPILIDTGLGVGIFPTCGRLPASLAAVGVMPEAIETILLTHLHGDHCGGMVDADGHAVFPNAEVVVHSSESAYWLEGVSSAEQAPADPNGVGMAKRALAAYEGRIRLIEDGAAEVVPGIAAVPLPGHTPGQTGFQIGSGPSSVLVWGDLVNLPFLQSALPEAGFVTDVDGSLSIKTRRSIMERAAEQGFLVAGMHIEFPGLAHVARDGRGYRLVPPQWTSNQ